MKHFLLIPFIIVFFAQYLCAQEPCKSYPMNGYTGSCSITKVLSLDYKYFYTSDQVTLKKWDIATNKVVEEISDFPYRLASNTGNPNKLKLQDITNLYNLESKAIDPKPEEQLLKRLNPDTKKIYEKFSKTSSTILYFNSDSTVAAIVDGSNTLYRLDMSTGKMEVLRMCHGKPRYVEGTNTLVTYYDKKGFVLVDFVTREKIPFTTQAQFDKAVLSPDQKYIVLTGRYTAFIDRKTGKEDFFVGDGDDIRFNTDGSFFFLFRMVDGFGGKIKIHHIKKYAYQGFVWKKDIDGLPRIGQFDKEQQILFDADKELCYTFDQGTWTSAVSLETGQEVPKASLSFYYTRNEAELKTEAERKDENARIGNSAIEKLADMKTPPYFHPLEGARSTSITGYTDNGLLLLQDNYHDGAACILWSFPGGKPLVAFSDEYSSERGAPPLAIRIPGLIRRSHLSPSGKTLAITSTEGIFIYEGSALKMTLKKMFLLALLEDQALVSASAQFPYEDILLVNTATGKVLRKVKSKPMYEYKADVTYKPGKIFLVSKYEVGVLDLGNPSEIFYYPNAEVAKSGYMEYLSDGNMVIDRATGNVAPTGLQPIQNGTGDQSTSITPYLINSYINEGFVIYDLGARKLVTQKPLYSGWMKYTLAVYFKNIQMLAVLSSVPKYTWPHAKDEDPGASAFTIDVKTGDVTPYLLTNNSAEYRKLVQKWDKVYYAYTAVSECDRKARNFPAGKYIVSTTGNQNPPSIVLGYDCQRASYVVVRRQLLFPGTNSTVLVSRPVEVTESDLYAQGYRVVDGGYKVCPSCNGYPAGFKTEYYSGWSDWEQKSLNIYLYTRKWETTKSQVLQLCKECHGEAWVK